MIYSTTNRAQRMAKKQRELITFEISASLPMLIMSNLDITKTPYPTDITMLYFFVCSNLN